MRRHIPRSLLSSITIPITIPKKRSPTCLLHPEWNIIRSYSQKTPSRPHPPEPLASTSRIPPLFTQILSSTDSTPKPFYVTTPIFYVTTPIFYVNASPHIGHLHSLILADVLARFARLRWPERQVIFATGTDEHGLKIQQAAKALGVEEGEFCTGVSQRFRDLAKLANISNTDFIRTTEERHYRSVEHFWNKLVASGDVYKGTHSGWYAISDECFYSPSQVREVDGKMTAIETGNPVVWEEEENWKFRLPNYRKKLRKWTAEVESVHPHSHRHEILRQIPDVEDLSISRPRSRVQWGIPVPGDSTQTIYVWVEALVNYLTVLGYPDSTRGWPVDVQVVGKDIVRFHALHWPALLFAAGLEPPRRVLTHAHWTMNKSKMSKSKGNVADPIMAMKTYGVDAVRWYLMRTGGSLADDSDYSERDLAVYHKQLRFQLGNLLNRIQSPALFPKIGEFRPDLSGEQEGPLHNALTGLRDVVEHHMEAYEVSKACERIMDVVMLVNQRFTALKPWEQLDGTTAIVYAYQALRIAGILLQPIMPSKSAELLDQLGIPSEERGWDQAIMPENKSLDTKEMVRRLQNGAGGKRLFAKV